MDNLGELSGFMPLPPGKLFKPDDDTAFPMIMVKAVLDSGPDTTADDFAEAMLNYLGDQRGTIWWGGYGVSTEHTAYLNLASGIPAALSGSLRLNGSALAEQIGGQIFSDIWGMILPVNPHAAADWAERAASISHDGNALHGARYIGALASLAFDFSTARRLVSDALSVLPASSEYARAVQALLDFHATADHDWRDAYRFVFDNFGYDRYPGVVPIIPNAAVIVLALLYGAGDFSRTLRIGNMCGWDTDCNVGNLGAIMGLAVGMAGIDPQWRLPMNDELVLASVTGADNYLDISECADRIADCGELLAGGDSTRSQYRYHFSYPTATQGFRIGPDTGKIIQLYSNANDTAVPAAAALAATGATGATGAVTVATAAVTVAAAASQDRRGLCAVIKKLGKKSLASFHVRTNCRTGELSANYYGASFSPKLYPGQTVQAALFLPPGSCETFIASLYVRDGNHATVHQAPGTPLVPGRSTALQYSIPRLENVSLDEAGIVVHNLGNELVDGRVILEYLSWNGQADYRSDFSMERPESGGISQWTIHRGFWRIEDGAYAGSGYESGESYSGAPQWRDYTVRAAVLPALGELHGLLARVQGARRSYVLALAPQGRLVLFKKIRGVLYELTAANWPWKHGQQYTLGLTVKAGLLVGSIDGQVLLRTEDTSQPYLNGQIGLLHGKACHTSCQWVDVQPA
jgi:hypothetical protein